MKLLLIITCLLICNDIFCQPKDYISLKKKSGKIVKNYYEGNYISFSTTNYQKVAGEIAAIKHDSLFIKKYHIQTYLTNWGTKIYDTVKVYEVPYHYKEIDFLLSTSRYTPEKIIGWFSSKVMILGAGYTVLNIFNTLTSGQSISDGNNLTKLGMGVGLFATGYLMTRMAKKTNSLKKYQVHYINMQ